jgi:uncharacterized membrane protein
VQTTSGAVLFAGAVVGACAATVATIANSITTITTTIVVVAVTTIVNATTVKLAVVQTLNDDCLKAQV